MIHENHQKLVERLGPLGGLVVDLSSQLKYPIQNQAQLARFFRPDQTLVVGASQHRVGQLVLQLPDALFPIESFDDMVEKLDQLRVRELQPADISKLLDSQPLIGFTVKRSEEVVRRRADQYFSQMGGPETSPEPLGRPPIQVDLQPERTKMRDMLGPLGDMVLDVSENVVFPVLNQAELSRQFDAEEHVRIGADAYPLAELALQVPDELFPIESLDDLVTKLAKGGIQEVQPERLRSLLDGVSQIGISIKLSEDEIRRRIERYGTEGMLSGGPENPPKAQEGQVPIMEDPRAGFAERANRLGPLGSMVLDLSEQITFPVKNVTALAANFTDEEVLFVGPRRYPLAQLALRMPEEIFPLESVDDLVQKLDRLGIRELSAEKVRSLLEADTFVGYSNPYKEDELRKAAERFEMNLGGPETPPPAARDDG